MKRNKEEEAGTVPGDLLSPAKRDTDGQEQNENNNLKKSWCVTKHCSVAGLPHSLLHLLFTASLTRYKYHCPFYRWGNWGSESEIFSPKGSKHFCKYKKYFGFCRPWLSVRSIQLCPCREKTAVDKSETEEKQAVGWIWSRGLRIPTPLLTQGHILNKEQG